MDASDLAAIAHLAPAERAEISASIARAAAAGIPIEFIRSGKGPDARKDQTAMARDPALQSEILRLQAQIAEAQARARDLQREISPQERDAMLHAKARHDSVASLYGESARDPVLGETEQDYRCALLQQLAPRTRSFKNSRFFRLDSAMLDHIERKAHAEVAEGHRHDASSVRGKLIPIQTRDPSGRLITTYEGDIGAFIAPFQATGMNIAINRKPNGEN